MPSIKLNLNLNHLFFVFLLTYGCGSFNSSSLVSADGIYNNNDRETKNSTSKYYENYFKDKALELENDFVFSDSIDLNLIALNITDKDGMNSSMTDVFGVAGTGIELIPPRQIMARIGYTF